MDPDDSESDQSLEPGKENELDEDSSESETTKGVTNDNVPSTNGLAKGSEVSSAATKGEQSDDHAGNTSGGGESDAASLSPMEEMLEDARHKNLEKDADRDVAPAPAQAEEEADEGKASSTKAVAEESEVKVEAPSKVVTDGMDVEENEKIHENNEKDIELNECEKTEIEQEKLKKLSKEEGGKTEDQEKKEKKLTKEERKLLREKLHLKRDCDVIDLETTVYVGNFPIKCSTKDVKRFFEPCGEIEEVVHPKKKDEDGKWIPLGWAFVRFKNEEGAKMAIMGTGAMVLGRTITIQKRKKSEVTESIVEETAVFVKNLPFKAEVKQIKKFFRQAGEVVRVKILRKGGKGGSLGLAFVRFKEAKSVKKALEELRPKPFMDRELRIDPAYIRADAKPPVTCRTVKLRKLPMGVKRHDVFKLIKENVGNCFVRMQKNSRSCLVDLLSHEHLLAVLQMRLYMFGSHIMVKAQLRQERRWVNPKWVEMAAVVCIEKIPLEVTEQEVYLKMRWRCEGVKHVALHRGKEFNRADVILEHAAFVSEALKMRHVSIRKRRLAISKWKSAAPWNTMGRREVAKPTLVFGCRVSKLPKKLTKIKLLKLTEKLIGKKEFSLIWEMNPKRNRFSGKVEFIFEELQDARFAKEAFEEFVIPGTGLGVQASVSERRTDSWKEKIEDLDEIRGLPRSSENSKKRSLQEGEEPLAKRVKQEELLDKDTSDSEMEVEQGSLETKNMEEPSTMQGTEVPA